MTTIESAQPQLLELAAAMRGEDWADDLAGALIAAKNAGWDWPKAFLYAARLMADSDATPRDLREACRRPLAPVRVDAEGAGSALAEFRRQREALTAGRIAAGPAHSEELALQQAAEARQAREATDPWGGGTA